MAPVDLTSVVLIALLNPAVIIVALLMGRSADQWQKLPVAAFAAALVGSGVVYIAISAGFSVFSDIRRAVAGVFTAEFLAGLVWAFIGYRFLRR
jgi:glycerol uptake facilitator-like aquaporin